MKKLNNEDLNTLIELIGIRNQILEKAEYARKNFMIYDGQFKVKKFIDFLLDKAAYYTQKIREVGNNED